jgi:type 1 glutamine amidotransferase
VREVGHQRIVYTNMGHPDGFEDAAVHRFLLNAARWCLRASDISAALSLAERVPA